MLVKLNKKRAHQVYRRKSDNKIVPGASTIAKIGDDASNLTRWAWKKGIEGLDYKKVTDEAADIGSVAHFLIQCHFLGNEADLSDFSSTAIVTGKEIFDKFMTTWSQSELTFVASELELVSELGYGGTLDVVARDKSGELVLIDIKSTPRVYSNHYKQISAYEALYNENHLEQIKRRAIFRHDKVDPEDNETRWIGDMKKYFDVFLAQLNLYWKMKDADK